MLVPLQPVKASLLLIKSTNWPSSSSKLYLLYYPLSIPDISNFLFKPQFSVHPLATLLSMILSVFLKITGISSSLQTQTGHLVLEQIFLAAQKGQFLSKFTLNILKNCYCLSLANGSLIFIFNSLSFSIGQFSPITVFFRSIYTRWSYTSFKIQKMYEKVRPNIPITILPNNIFNKYYFRIILNINNYILFSFYLLFM